MSHNCKEYQLQKQIKKNFMFSHCIRQKRCKMLLSFSPTPNCVVDTKSNTTKKHDSDNE